MEWTSLDCYTGTLNDCVNEGENTSVSNFYYGDKHVCTYQNDNYITLDTVKINN